MSCHVMSCHVILYHITPYIIHHISYTIKIYHVSYVMLCHTKSYHAISYHVMRIQHIRKYIHIHKYDSTCNGAKPCSPALTRGKSDFYRRAVKFCKLRHTWACGRAACNASAKSFPGLVSATPFNTRIQELKGFKKMSPTSGSPDRRSSGGSLPALESFANVLKVPRPNTAGP